VGRNRSPARSPERTQHDDCGTPIVGPERLRHGLDQRYNGGYTRNVKTAISLPNDLFKDAEALAAELGVTRSQLYAWAIEEYVRTRSKNEVAKRLRDFYGQGVEPDAAVTSYSRKILKRAEW